VEALAVVDAEAAQQRHRRVVADDLGDRPRAQAAGSRPNASASSAVETPGHREASAPAAPRLSAAALPQRMADARAYGPGAGGFSGPLGSSAAERAAAVFSSLTAAQISSR
jgi:hypothetical protein